jgi:hypothetical protein
LFVFGGFLFNIPSLLSTVLSPFDRANVGSARKQLQHRPFSFSSFLISTISLNATRKVSTFQ